MRSPWYVPRRVVLRAAGASIALPFLEAMRVPGARAAQAPTRMVFFLTPNGFYVPAMRCQGAGREFTLADSLGSLADLKQDILFTSGLNDLNHFRDAHCIVQLMTNLQPSGKSSDGSWQPNGASFDQLVAGRFAASGVAFPSLLISTRTNRPSDGAVFGDAPEYDKHFICWTPQKTFIRPRESLSDLFSEVLGGKPVGPGAPDSDSAWQRRNARLQSVLDATLAQMGDLNRRLGEQDRSTLAQYVQGIRDVERRLSAVQAASEAQCSAGIDPASTLTTVFPDKVKLALDMIALIVACDRSRLILYQTDGETSDHKYDHIVVPDDLTFDGQQVAPDYRQRIQDKVKRAGYHGGISHHNGNLDMIGAMRMIDRWSAGQYGYLLRKLKAQATPSGTLLDSSMVVQCAPIGDGSSHSPRNIPMMIGGRGGGAVQPGRVVNFGAASVGEPFAKLLLTLCDACGVPLPSLGDTSGRLTLT